MPQLIAATIVATIILRWGFELFWPQLIAATIILRWGFELFWLQCGRAPLGSIFAVLNAPHGSTRQCAPCGRLCASQTLPVGASCFKDYDSTLSATKVVSASTPYKLF